MNLVPAIWYVSGLLAAAMGLTIAWRDRHSLAHWGLAAGLWALAAESVCSAFSVSAMGLPDRVFWQQWRFVAMAFGPGAWLLFSLTYARGNFRPSLARWRAPLVLAFIVPLGLVGVFHDQLL